jgi:hypothetical protein
MTMRRRFFVLVCAAAVLGGQATAQDAARDADRG